MNIMRKVLIISMMMLLCCSLVMNSPVFATNTTTSVPVIATSNTGAGAGAAGTAGEKVNQLLSEQATEGEIIGITNTIAGTVITVAKVACAGVAIIMLIVLAMKYMLSSVEDRATIKKHAVVYVVGAVVMFAASSILSIIEDFAANLE